MAQIPFSPPEGPGQGEFGLRQGQNSRIGDNLSWHVRPQKGYIWGTPSNFLIWQWNSVDEGEKRSQSVLFPILCCYTSITLQSYRSSVLKVPPLRNCRGGQIRFSENLKQNCMGFGSCWISTLNFSCWNQSDFLSASLVFASQTSKMTLPVKLHFQKKIGETLEVVQWP